MADPRLKRDAKKAAGNVEEVAAVEAQAEGVAAGAEGAEEEVGSGPGDRIWMFYNYDKTIICIYIYIYIYVYIYMYIFKIIFI